MDMQNVSNLQIPEGAVRTIHDKDSRLIWGRVAYNTKYAGDTYQQTYSGKNLWQIRKENQTVGQVAYTYNQDGTFSLSGDPTGGGTVKVIVPLASSGITPGQTYTIWTDHGIGWGENQVMYYIQSCKADGTWVANIATFTNAVRTQTVASTDEQYIMFVLSWSANGNYTNFNNVKAQLVAGSTADSDFEPYTAGPAPNPEYPQEIQTVTGEQTVMVTGRNLLDEQTMQQGSFNFLTGVEATDARRIRSTFIECKPNTNYNLSANVRLGEFAVIYKAQDGTIIAGEGASTNEQSYSFTSDANAYYMRIRVGNGSYPKTTEGNYGLMLAEGSVPTTYEPYQSQTYTISLGSIELCKIGDYQDYIYKSGDDWYVHKAINKVILNGSEAWSMYSGRDGTFYITKSDIMPATSISATPDVISDYYEPKPFASLYNMIVDYGVANHNAQRWIAIRNKDYSDVSSFKTWLASNNTTVYYVLATPANTKITDNTLIDQLNAVHQWATRYGYNATASGDLPIVLQRDSLQ